MTKKWLYSAVLGALLIVGEAFGITVHEALSNDFWPIYKRPTRAKLFELGQPRCKRLKSTNTKDDEGSHWFFLDRFRATRGSPWTEKRWINRLIGNDGFFQDDVTVHRTLKARGLWNSVTDSVEHEEKDAEGLFRFSCIDETYKATSRSKKARPSGPYVVDDWFPDEMRSKSYQESVFYGTEHNAVTNIISDNEAYITGTIYQTGHIDEYDGGTVNEDASLVRTYTQHFTTDENHVYVQQEITEDAHNDPGCDSQNTYQTQYTATFKKGRWKNETETISKVSQRSISPWALKILQNEKY